MEWKRQARCPRLVPYRLRALGPLGDMILRALLHEIASRRRPSLRAGVCARVGGSQRLCDPSPEHPPLAPLARQLRTNSSATPHLAIYMHRRRSSLCLCSALCCGFVHLSYPEPASLNCPQSNARALQATVDPHTPLRSVACNALESATSSCVRGVCARMFTWFPGAPSLAWSNARARTATPRIATPSFLYSSQPIFTCPSLPRHAEPVPAFPP